MIKTLQKKFIVTAMIAITVLLVVLLGAINVVNIWATSQETDRMLGFISHTHTEQKGQPPDRYTERRGIWDHTFSKDDIMSAVYFTVEFDNYGEIDSVDVTRISSVTEFDARELAIEVYNKKETGNIGKFRYTRIPPDYVRGTVYIFMDISSNYISLVRIVVLSLVVGIICWALMLLLVVLLSRKAIRPIAENIQKQRQFVTDAGHEIKVPLAIILANTDAMELHNGENKWSKNIRNQVIRLNGLMQNLLTLARADEEKKMVSCETFSLSDLMENSIAYFEEPMRMKHLEIQKNIDSNTMIYAGKQQFSNLVSILMDNAVKYSAADGVIEIRLINNSKHVELQIENECEALPECDPDRLFDRFHRADAARTQKNGGYGIGLAAARTIVESCSGEISAQYLPQNRITFTVRFQK